MKSVCHPPVSVPVATDARQPKGSYGKHLGSGPTAPGPLPGSLVALSRYVLANHRLGNY
jgi:hypothetical protein